MIRVDARSADLGRSGWEAILPRAPAACPALTQDIDSDYLVVGAGFAGLAAARRLRQLDAGQRELSFSKHSRLQTGPAGRNSGFMIDLPHALASGSYAGDDSADRRHISPESRGDRLCRRARARISVFPPEVFARSGKVNAAAGPVGTCEHNRRLCAPPASSG